MNEEHFWSYVSRLKTEKDKDKQLKNPWALTISDARYREMFERVQSEGLDFDGIHITIQKTGLTYDYVAYKNKMLLAYPETVMDVAIVHEGDLISFSKENGSVLYTHTISDPFGKKPIIGAYAIIRNKRGESLTTLSAEEIAKHRKVAKTDFIWATWFKEMVMKTIVKKACKQHYADIYEKIINEDNEENDIDSPVDIELSWKQEVEAISTIEELKKYYEKNRGKGKSFDALVTKRKLQLTQS